MARVLVVGGGGREHALAWQLLRSPSVSEVLVAPGNGGTAEVCENVPVAADDIRGLVAVAKERAVDLVVVGPEVALAGGLVDACAEHGILCFGPTRAAARLEWSKSFAKAFMARHLIPSAKSRAFTDYVEARAWLADREGPCVVKASGLAAGKGVIVCDDEITADAALRAMLHDERFGEAGREVVVEERLRGDEVSLLAFCDGERFALMPTAQDHKRALDGDQGANTGGMGAVAPAPRFEVDAQRLGEQFIAPVLKGMRDAGTPFRGVLYAGLMMTGSGPRVLEYNVRFGDPETQVILPLFDGDLYDVLVACASGTLDPEAVRWRRGSAATVVLASGGYPGAYDTGLVVQTEPLAMADATVFHAGTRRGEGALQTAGGRVFAVTGVGTDLSEALNRAYSAAGSISFPGMHFRRDIGQRAVLAQRG